MWSNVRYFFCLLIPLFLFEYGYSEHIVGGELSYKCIGNNNYIITLKLYRDCNGSGAVFDDPTTITILNGSGQVEKTIDISFPGSSIVPNNTYNLCLTAPPNICVEEAIFTSTVNLPRVPGGYTLVYQRCCRNNSVLNIKSPSFTGASYVATIPDSLIASCNSSPVFKEFPPTVICVNEPVIFDHSAKDPDGDSLTYQFFNPFAGGNIINVYPVPASSPPYPLVNFSGYTYNNPIGGTVPLTINPKTGIMKGTPNTIGQFIVGVAVKEYRKGILLSTHYRDFQLNVVECVKATSTSFNVSTPMCKGKRIDFTNNSSTGKNYYWDFGTGKNKDTSSLFSPSFTYKEAGTYTVKLILNKGMTCESSDSIKITVSASPDSEPISNTPVCVGSSIRLNANKVNDATYSWTGPSGFVSDKQNPLITSASLQDSGDYFLIVSIHGCNSVSAKTTVTVNPVPVVIINSNSPVCTGQSIRLLAHSIPGSSFSWTGANGFISQQQNPVISNSTADNAGAYTVTTDINGCKGGPVSTEVIVLPSPPSPQISNSSPICSGSPLYLHAENIAGGVFSWKGPNNFSSAEQNPAIPAARFADSGTFSATVTVNGCISPPATTEAIINFSPTANFTVTPQGICPGMETVITYTGDGDSTNDFTWRYNTETVTGRGPHTVRFDSSGTVPFVLTVSAPKCPPNTSTQMLVIDTVPTANFSSADLGCAPLPVFFKNKTRNGKTYNWIFGDGKTSREENPFHSYLPGTYSVKLIATSTNGCADSITKSNLIQVIPNPVASFNTYPSLSHAYELSESYFQFTNQSRYYKRYVWHFGDGDSSEVFSPEHAYSDTGDYTVTLIAYGDVGCIDSMRSTIIRIVPDLDYYIPNAFTPNNDGINDVFRVYGRSINSVHLVVFDRFGEKVFESGNMNNGWDGRYKNIPLNTGIYIYSVKIETLTGEKITKKGDVFLLR